MIGYVYIMVNVAFPDLIKIGRTTKSASERATDLYTTGTPGKFIVLYDQLVDDCEEIEKQMHEYFDHARFSGNREFFSVLPKDAITKLQELSRFRLIQNSEYFIDAHNSMITEEKEHFYLYRAEFVKKPISGNYQISKNDINFSYRYGTVMVKEDEEDDEELFKRNLENKLKTYYSALAESFYFIKSVSIKDFDFIGNLNIQFKSNLDNSLIQFLNTLIKNDNLEKKWIISLDEQTINTEEHIKSEYDSWEIYGELISKVQKLLKDKSEKESQLKNQSVALNLKYHLDGNF